MPAVGFCGSKREVEEELDILMLFANIGTKDGGEAVSAAQPAA
jgi:hypothetical protein